MLTEKEEKLKQLQEVKTALSTMMEKRIPRILWENYQARINEIKNEMANLNKLDDNEKNIHVIWIGVLPKYEFNNLKLWAKYNPDYKIHIWTDSSHILTNQLDNIIFANSWNEDATEYDYQREAMLRDDFYNNWHLTNPEKTFDENAKEFLLDGSKDETIILEWLKEGQESFIQEQTEIESYTPSQVILHDVNQEKDNIFPNEKYYQGYLKTLEHLHICAGAADRLRYAVLNKFGGVYLDTDVAVKFNLQDLKDNQEMMNLINLVELNRRENLATNVLLNQMILFNNLKQLNDDHFEDFAKKWEIHFGGDYEKNLPVFKEIFNKFKDMSLNLTPNMEISDFPIDNAFQIIFSVNGVDDIEDDLHDHFDVNNCFIISKKDSKFLQDIMKKIEVTDEKIKNLDTYKKMVNKNEMIIHQTGPTNIIFSFKEKDQNYFDNYANHTDEIFSEEVINGCSSTWYDNQVSKDIITDDKELKSLFFSDATEVQNYLEQNEKQLNELEKENSLEF
ncbi:MAG: glycosyltransferase [Spiroplasma sp.]|nr:glycosyltransferase [Spiroplasma sp.]